MSKTIWKFPLPLMDFPAVTMPANAEILAAQMQGSAPCLWALVDPDAPMETRLFAIVGTGHPATDRVLFENYIATVQDGPFVWHIFEVLR